MNHKLGSFLSIIGILVLLAWTPGASAASWSSTVCKVPPTYGPYCCTKYYCPAVGSFEPTTFLTGSIASDVNQCTDTRTTNCIKVVDTIDLDTTDPNVPNQLLQCGVPGGDTCKNPGKCGDSSGSSGAVFINQSFSASLSADFTSSSCTKDAKTKQIKCIKSQHFGGLEGDAAAAAQFCQNPNWQIIKWLALRLIARNWLVYSSDPSTPVSQTDFSCVLLDPNGLRPGQQGYAPDLVTLSNNLYECVELLAP